MKVSEVLGAGSLLLLAFLSGCSRSDADENAVTASAGFFQCQEPRPEICYEIFSPVCAIVTDPDMRCVTTPCPSDLQVTYSNDCKACADSRVIGYVQGQCQ